MPACGCRFYFVRHLAAAGGCFHSIAVLRAYRGIIGSPHKIKRRIRLRHLPGSVVEVCRFRFDRCTEQALAKIAVQRLGDVRQGNQRIAQQQALGQRQAVLWCAQRGGSPQGRQVSAGRKACYIVILRFAALVLYKANRCRQIIQRFGHQAGYKALRRGGAVVQAVAVHAQGIQLGGCRQRFT